jgi:hypothetical protein
MGSNELNEIGGFSMAVFQPFRSLAEWQLSTHCGHQRVAARWSSAKKFAVG